MRAKLFIFFSVLVNFRDDLMLRLHLQIYWAQINMLTLHLNVPTYLLDLHDYRPSFNSPLLFTQLVKKSKHYMYNLQGILCIPSK